MDMPMASSLPDPSSSLSLRMNLTCGGCDGAPNESSLCCATHVVRCAQGARGYCMVTSSSYDGTPEGRSKSTWFEAANMRWFCQTQAGQQCQLRYACWMHNELPESVLFRTARLPLRQSCCRSRSRGRAVGDAAYNPAGAGWVHRVQQPAMAVRHVGGYVALERAPNDRMCEGVYERISLHGLRALQTSLAACRQLDMSTARHSVLAPRLLKPRLMTSSSSELNCVLPAFQGCEDELAASTTRSCW
jgi:hypothetical protein